MSSRPDPVEMRRRLRAAHARLKQAVKPPADDRQMTLLPDGADRPKS